MHAIYMSWGELVSSGRVYVLGHAARRETRRKLENALNQNLTSPEFINKPRGPYPPLCCEPAGTWPAPGSMETASQAFPDSLHLPHRDDERIRRSCWGWRQQVCWLTLAPLNQARKEKMVQQLKGEKK